MFIGRNRVLLENNSYEEKFVKHESCSVKDIRSDIMLTLEDFITHNFELNKIDGLCVSSIPNAKDTTTKDGFYIFTANLRVWFAVNMYLGQTFLCCKVAFFTRKFSFLTFNIVIYINFCTILKNSCFTLGNITSVCVGI